MTTVEFAKIRDHFDHTAEGFAQRALNTYREMREKCPVTRSDQLGGFWVVSKYDTIIKILRQPDVFTSGEGIVLPALPFPQRGIPSESDPPLHTDYRGVFMPFLTPKAVAGYEPLVRERVTALIDEFIADGKADFVAQFATRLPGQVVAEFFGFDFHDGERCYEWLNTMMAPPDGDPATAAAAGQNLFEFIVGVLAEARAKPKNNLISSIANYVTKAGTRFSDDECIGLVFTAIGGALETTVAALTAIVVFLDEFSTARAQLIADPTLVNHAVQEVLRMSAPAHCPARTVHRDVEVDGMAFKAGDRVLLLFGSANNDEERFTDPEQFRLDRGRNPHITFGHGIHRCVGAPLAELEIRVTLEEILKRMPDIRVLDKSGPTIRNGGTWGFESLDVDFTPSPVETTSNESPSHSEETNVKVWRMADDSYWQAAPAGTSWAATVAAAGEAQGFKTAMHALGDPTDEHTTVVVIVQFPPNYVLPRHSHQSDRLELVVAGSVEVDGYWLGPGDIWTSRAGEFYGPHTMGADGCTTMELATVAGAHKLSFDVDGTAIDVDFSDPAALAGLASFLK
ncbi:cytochrome P450 [Mycolicibacterium holsaticum]|nr:cytochrome P450 [Mycolicibacterium holsaticum]